jgi:putative membrane protein
MEWDRGIGLWWIIGISIIVAIVCLVIKTMNKKSNRNTSSGKIPLHILKEKYVKG